MRRDTATRFSSARPATSRCQWWTVRMARAASKQSSGKGRTSAVAWMHGAMAEGRWAIIARDGSTAITSRSAGS